jgi:cellobiose transport system permease protein
MTVEIGSPSSGLPYTVRSVSRLQDRWRRATPYLFISPFFVIFALFGVIPILFSLAVSLTDWRGVRVGQFVGLENFVALFGDAKFLKALVNTGVIWVGSVPTMIFLAVLFAVLINSRTTLFRNLYRTVYFLPVVTSLVVTGLVFSQLFSQSYGMINNVLLAFGLKPVNWLGEPALMKLVLVLALLWRWTGNDMVIMLAGLQSIPGELFEAATVDGANERQIFFGITIPLLMPVILFDLIISTIGTFNLFGEPYALFGGPDGGAYQGALVTGTYLYQTSFVFSKFGYGAAMTWVLALLILVLSWVQNRIGGRSES